MRYVVDSSWWRRTSPTAETLVAGSPVRVMRLDPRAGPLLDALEGGTEPPTPSPSLIHRLLDNGAIHPIIDSDATPRLTVADVTVVIPVHNERHHEIVELVRSVVPAARVIVVDDGSEIPLAAIPGADIIRRDSPGGPSAARNSGSAVVETELILFIDADVIWNPEVWLPLLKHFDDERVAAVAPRVTSSPGPSVLERYERARSPLDLGPESARVRAGTRVSFVPAAAIMMRTKVVRSIGGFDESLRYGEDVDLVWRMDGAGFHCRYEADTQVVHRPRTSMTAAWRQRASYGSAAAGLDAKHHGAVAPLRVNRWSLVAWLLVATGHTLVGVGTAAVSTAMLVRKLNTVENRASIAVRLAGRGNLHAGRLIAGALTRTWWPLTLMVGLFSRRARRVALCAVVVPNIFSWWTTRPDLDVVRYVSMRALDDMAYGTGVWTGVRRSRRLGPLVPIID